MFHQSRKTARAAMGAIGLLAVLFLLAACGSLSPKLASSSLLNAQSHDAAGNAQTPDFAGYSAVASGTYTGAEVTFTVPSFQQPTGGPKVAYAASVAGGGAVADAGIYSYLDPTGAQINKAYWEANDSNTGLKQSQDLALGGGTGAGVVSPGDQITVFVTWGPNGASFTVYDDTTKDRGSSTVSDNTGNAYAQEGATAGCGVFVSLTDPQPPADFGTVQIQHCQATNSTVGTTTLNAFQTFPSDMVTGSFGASTSTPIGNNGHFSVTWQNS